MSEEEIADILRKENLSDYPDPTKLSPLAQAFWILEVVKDKAKIKRVTSKTISFLLSELKEIDLKEKTIIRAFARAGNKIKPFKEGGEVYYEIMASGREFIKERAYISENGVLFFTGDNSWSDPNKNFPKVIEMLQEDLCIVDPFYGNGTFYVLEKFGKNRKIRFLSCTLGNEEKQNESKFTINLQRFRKEFKNIEIRKYNKPYELHDRYIIAKNALVVIGHGIKDLASKESFIIFLPEKLVTGFLPKLKKIFDERWKKSTKLT